LIISSNSNLIASYDAVRAAAEAASNAAANTGTKTTDNSNIIPTIEEGSSIPKSKKTSMVKDGLVGNGVYGNGWILMKDTEWTNKTTPYNGTSYRQIVKDGKSYYIKDEDKNHYKTIFGTYYVYSGTQLYQLKSLKTGGYTGAWQNGSQESNGRLAMLHQKELVLNETDTANFLSAVDIVRQLDDSLVLLKNNGMTKILNAMANKVDTIENGQNIEQNVVINADFSGVRDAQEIVEAIDMLENLASQKINKS